MPGQLPRAAIPTIRARGAIYVRQDLAFRLWGALHRLADTDPYAVIDDFHAAQWSAALADAKAALVEFDALGGHREPPE